MLTQELAPLLELEQEQEPLLGLVEELWLAGMVAEQSAVALEAMVGALWPEPEERLLPQVLQESWDKWDLVGPLPLCKKPLLG